jgi:predicted RNA-binding protein YlqC (UPF0109 family)
MNSLPLKTMSKRGSKIASTLKQLGDIQVAEWDFMGLMNTEIRELEISRSLRELGNLQVMDWDFRTVIPVVKKVANTEVDVIDIFKRTASYKVMDWDFSRGLSAEKKQIPQDFEHPEMQAIALQLKDFLQYVVVNLIDEPNHAQIKVAALKPRGLRFKVVLVKKDLAMLIGREGFTASAIRNVLKAAAAMHGVQALLQIHSHEDEAAMMVKEQGMR